MRNQHGIGGGKKKKEEIGSRGRFWGAKGFDSQIPKQNHYTIKALETKIRKPHK